MKHAVATSEESVREIAVKYCTKRNGHYPQGLCWIPVALDGKVDDRYYIRICNDFGRLVCFLMYGCQPIRVIHHSDHRPDHEKVAGLILKRLPKALNGFLDEIMELSFLGFKKDDSFKANFGMRLDFEGGVMKIHCLEVGEEIHYGIDVIPDGVTEKNYENYGEFGVGNGCGSFKEALVRFYADDCRMGRGWSRDVARFVKMLPGNLKDWMARNEKNFTVRHSDYYEKRAKA
ncbi:MAG: hypothetical protein J6Y62_00115 [Clostridia bacterium]|nr:hypothetical protein [Clostridia bacterium]